MKRLLICDLDGTIVDSMPFLSALGVAVLRLANPTMSFEDALTHYRATTGHPFQEQLRVLKHRHGLAPMQFLIRGVSGILGSEEHAYAELYADMHERAAGFFPLTPFGLALANSLRWNKDQQWKLALVSSTSRHILNGMDQLGAIPWNHRYGWDGGKFTKEYQIIEASEKAHVPLRSCIYVGDTVSDHAIAIDLGLPFFSVHDKTLDDVLDTYRDQYTFEDDLKNKDVRIPGIT